MLSWNKVNKPLFCYGLAASTGKQYWRSDSPPGVVVVNPWTESQPQTGCLIAAADSLGG